MAVKNGDTNERDVTSRDKTYQRDKYGGVNVGAAFFGWLVANSVSILLVALLAALGSAVALTATNSAQELANQAPTIGLVSGIFLLLSFAVAYFAGGYVAGRMSRFDGGKQGLGVWVIGIIANIIFGLAGVLLGASFNLVRQLNLPSIPVDGNTLTAGGMITLLAIILVTMLAAMAGGKAGVRYHHKVDEAGRPK